MAVEQKPTVLVVDDEQPILSILRTLLDEGGFTVLTATDGETALAVAVAQQPDLILTDLMMPLMGGRELLRRLRADPHTERIPVMLMTVANDVSTEEGFAAVMRKPFFLDKVVESIRLHLENGSPRREWAARA